MRAARVAPTLPLSAPIEKHLEVAGVSHPMDVAHRMAEQEYDSWHEVVLLSIVELKDLLDVIGLKHKSATKLSRYAEDYRRYNQQELATERPESMENNHIRSNSTTHQNTNQLKEEEIPPPLEEERGPSVSETNPPEEQLNIITSSDQTIQLKQNEDENFILESGEGTPSPKISRSQDLDHGQFSVSSINMSNEVPTAEDVIASHELIQKATSAAQDHSNFGAAVDLFRDAIALNPNNDAAWFGLGYSLYQRDGGNTEEQITCYERAISLNPQHAMARSNLGNQLLTLRKDFIQAEVHFRTAIDLDKSCADAHNHLGWLLQHSKDGIDRSDEAEQLFRNAIELDPAYIDAHVNLGWLLHDVRKDPIAAEACYRRAIELDPNNVQANYNLGLLLDGKGDDGAKAEERYRRALELDPNNVLALISLGSLLETVRQDMQGAEVCYRRAIQIDPDNPNARNCLGVLLEIGVPTRVDEAEACYRKAISLDPSHSSATYNLGLLLEVVRRDFDGAEACYRKTISLDPENANAHSNLGILLKDVRNDFDGAEVMYRRAIDLDPSHSAACNNLGTLLETVRGDLVGAEAMYRRAMELDMKNSDAVLNLGILLHGKAERMEHELKASISASSVGDSNEMLVSPDLVQLALSTANMYCEAAALWDLSDGEGNRYSSASRLSASQLRAMSSATSRPNTPKTSLGAFHAANLSPIQRVGSPMSGIRPARPSSARSRPSSAQSSRPVSQSGRPRTRSNTGGGGGFTGLPANESSKTVSPTLAPAISPQDAAIVSGIGISLDNDPEGNNNNATGRPWAAAADAAEKAAKELAAVAVKLESFSVENSSLDGFKLDSSTHQPRKSAGFSNVVGTSMQVAQTVNNMVDTAIANDSSLELPDSMVLDEENDEDALVSIFRVVDRNGDGGVSRCELQKALNNKGEEGSIMRSKLCRILGLPSAVTDRKARSVFELVFDCIDSDGGATLELDEMQLFVKDMNQVASIYAKSQSPGYDPKVDVDVDPRIVELLESSDSNRDGQLSHVEIIRAMKLYPDIRNFLRS